jgi:hypothetical protein
MTRPSPIQIANEYANVQLRINCIVLPGVSALGPVLDTNFIGSMAPAHRHAAGAVRSAHCQRALKAVWLGEVEAQDEAATIGKARGDSRCRRRG